MTGGTQTATGNSGDDARSVRARALDPAPHRALPDEIPHEVRRATALLPFGSGECGG
jgi:hypothetical protein